VSDETPEERAQRTIERMAMSDCNEVDLARDVLALSAEVDHLHRQRVDLADELAEVSDECDRLRHGEKVRDGMLRRIIHREHRQVGWVVSGDEWWSLEPADGTFVEVREPLTPDEVAVLAALDTEEGG
jgi:hypothetical protein